MQEIATHGNIPTGFQLKRGKLLYKDRIVPPKGSSKILTILKEFHDTAIGGHAGIFRTYKRISALFYWEGMKLDIQNFVQRCEVCQRNKYEALNPAGYLQPLPIPS